MESQRKRAESPGVGAEKNVRKVLDIATLTIAAFILFPWFVRGLQLVYGWLYWGLVYLFLNPYWQWAWEVIYG
ncbi:MAG TPA: hypothetical protein ENI05_06855 [Porticoccus sp.]|nr:hypothetical protein [Porticoccus sp.]